MTREQSAAIHEALARAAEELRGWWPLPRQRDRSQHMVGYTRERGRRAIVKEEL
jgi:hypothetical protein